jgi:hypothetical protein
MKAKVLKFDGITLNELVPAKYPNPSWCDVYVEGKLLFENVTVNEDNGVVYLYNTAYTNGGNQRLVAILKSNNYLIMARQTK